MPSTSATSDDWRDSPWVRVTSEEARYASINRFLDRHRRGSIHVAEPDEKNFQEVLSSSSVLVIRGLPGSGKTLTALEQVCKLRAPLRRIYYATFKDSPDPSRLWKSVSRRISLPTVLILDDCHLNLEQTGSVLERLEPELKEPKGHVKLLLVLRDLPGSASEKVDETPDWLVRLEQSGLVMDMKTDLVKTRAVTQHLRPELIGLSSKRLEHLHHLSGGDLLLLDEILSRVESPPDLDTMGPHLLYNSVRKQYFGGNRRLPTVRRLACLAQFDLSPAAEFFDTDWQTGEKNLVAPLMTELFAPPRYQFLHSSLAELVLRALLALEMEPGRVEVAAIENTAMELIKYLQHLVAASTDGTSRDSGFMQNIEMLLRVNLKLAEGTENARIKVRLLDDKFIRGCIEQHLGDCSFDFLHRCMAVLTTEPHPTTEYYECLIERRFKILFQNAREGGDSAGMATIGTGFMTLALNAPSWLSVIQDVYGAERFLHLITTNGTLFELFKILQYATPTFREALLDRLEETGAEALLDKTIAAGRSIGTLHLTIRELGDTDRPLLERLERAIGAERFLHLITTNGTLFELFKILQYATPTFREALLDRLEETGAEALLDKTIAAGRSIESLHHTFWQLRQCPGQRKRLEELLGVDSWWRLFIGVGTLNSLIQTSRAMSEKFRGLLIKASIGLNIADWQSIISRGLYLNACTFTNEELAGYPESSRIAFQEALSETALPLVAKASWYDLNPSRPPDSPDSLEGQMLRAALRTRIGGLKPKDLLGMDFREAVNGFTFAWRERPDLRPTLAAHLWDILPELADWPREGGEIAALRLVLVIARSELITTEDTHQLLAIICEFLDHEVCGEIHSFPLFLLLWNIAVVQFERGAGITHSFEGALPNPLIQAILDLLHQRVSPKGPNKEKLAKLALAGLLSFLVPHLANELRKILATLAGITKWLYPEALKQTFVPGLFSLEGIALLKPSETVLTPIVRAGLLAKSEEYEDIGLAIEFLRQHLKCGGKLR